jgi:hypothetical protein
VLHQQAKNKKPSVPREKNEKGGCAVFFFTDQSRFLSEKVDFDGAHKRNLSQGCKDDGKGRQRPKAVWLWVKGKTSEGEPVFSLFAVVVVTDL